MEKGKQTYELPEGWIWKTIGDIGIVQSGGTPSTHNKEFLGEEISWITPADFSGYNEKYISPLPHEPSVQCKLAEATPSYYFAIAKHYLAPIALMAILQIN
ncbi:MAG: hypothetical protein RBS81_11615 [Tenuifilaceae bacterium]|jgi:hypothetical protein|nr:hypothetical protein [Tenuifilaceae bacterium]